CRGTAQHVKVALSGEGGDEVLGGYTRYFWGPLVDKLRPLMLPYAGDALALAGLLPSHSLGVFNVARRVTKLAASLELDTPARSLAWFDLFTADERRGLVREGTGEGTDGALARYQTLFDEANGLGLDPVQRMQYVDFQTMLLDNLLMKADKISMAHSLEVRVPFLSAPLVEFGLGLPESQKIGARQDKRLMRRLLRPRLGGRLANRPKRGFEIPVDRWFREPATDSLRAQLARGPLVTELGFDATAIETLVRRHLGGEDIGRKLFALTSLERWAQRFA
ncbi:MAG: asparagine synthase-related protein, partial [Solirubrobacteraceae bacterium]